MLQKITSKINRWLTALLWSSATHKWMCSNLWKDHVAVCNFPQYSITHVTFVHSNIEPPTDNLTP